MKNILLFSVSVLLSAFLLLFLPTEADAAIYDDTIRLHVIANSDSDFDQSLKLSVRDFVLASFSDNLYATDKEKVKENATLLLPNIEKAVNQKLEESGVLYRAQVTLTEEDYDTRTYESFMMPSGRYLSLRIILGDGVGKNWWCVMYPPMCLDLCTENTSSASVAAYSEEEMNLIANDEYQIKFKLLEVASDLGDKIRKKN